MNQMQFFIIYLTSYLSTNIYIALPTSGSEPHNNTRVTTTKRTHKMIWYLVIIYRMMEMLYLPLMNIATVSCVAVCDTSEHIWLSFLMCGREE